MLQYMCSINSSSSFSIGHCANRTRVSHYQLKICLQRRCKVYEYIKAFCIREPKKTEKNDSLVDPPLRPSHPSIGCLQYIIASMCLEWSHSPTVITCLIRVPGVVPQSNSYHVPNLCAWSGPTVQQLSRA